MKTKAPAAIKYLMYPDRNTKIGFVVVESSEKGRKEIFHHTDENVAKKALSDAQKGKFDAKKYPKMIPAKPLILLFKEKHGDMHFVYNTREEFYKIILNVLTRRYEDGWYNYQMDEPKKEITMTLEEIQALPDPKLKAFQMNRYNGYEQEMADFKNYQELQRLTEKAYKEKNEKLAHYVMDERREGEYESFEIIEPYYLDEM